MAVRKRLAAGTPVPFGYGLRMDMGHTDAGLDDLKWWLSEKDLAIISVDAYKYEYMTAEDLWTTDQYSSPSRNHANTVVGYDDSYGPICRAENSVTALSRS
ncbi:MAG: hypothetical protein U5N26_09070 [Candidatus Marinimicrobia bacterium]|nr:hypothetical protein [Candidatus Neomarinimicrobiota bacterium]